MTYLEEVPQVHKVSCEHEFLRLGDEAVGHEAEILDQLGCSMNAGIHIQFGSSQQTQQQVVYLMEDHGGVRGQWKFTGWQVEGARGAEHLAERVAGNEGDEEICCRWRKERGCCHHHQLHYFLFFPQADEGPCELS